MKVCCLLLICFFCPFLAAETFAQNLFTEKVDIEHTSDYCMDCGSPKATCDEYTLDQISDKINRKYNFKNGFGSLSFQVLIDPTGFSCVLSHSDITHSALSSDLIICLNTCFWSPAMVNGQAVNSSVNVVFTIAYGKISGAMQRLDLAELAAPGSPTIYNQQYQYANPSIKNYDFTSWSKYNSPLPDNIGQACMVDKSDVCWYASAKGLTRFDGTTFSAVNETNSPLNATTSVQSLAVDIYNNKWMIANRNIYMNDDKGWQIFDSTHVAIAGGYHVIVNPGGELFFANKKGLMIFKNSKARLVDNKTIWQMPSNDVYYGYFDKHERFWIGTARGTIMVDKNQKVTEFNLTNTPLKNTCITDVAEDENGNLYFSSKAFKSTDGDPDEEGLTVFSADGKWSHYNDKNSGMPVNRISTVHYDKVAHVLWIGTHKAGLVRFDLKDGWENYNNNNSAMPGFDIAEIAEDSKGIIYAATANGLLRVMKK
jgi:hypothetical protein